MYSNHLNLIFTFLRVFIGRLVVTTSLSSWPIVAPSSTSVVVVVVVSLTKASSCWAPGTVSCRRFATDVFQELCLPLLNFFVEVRFQLAIFCRMRVVQLHCEVADLTDVGHFWASLRVGMSVIFLTVSPVEILAGQISLVVRVAFSHHVVTYINVIDPFSQSQFDVIKCRFGDSHFWR